MRRSVTGNSVTGTIKKETGNGIKATFLATAVVASAIVVFYFGTRAHTAQAVGPQPAARQAVASKSFSLPMFFEPNQGQTDPQVKFLARGSGYGLFLTADEAVLKLHRSAARSQSPASSVIRMRLDGANTSAHVSGASPLPGKSNYFLGNDSSKWRSGIPQFARVEYKSVYPGVDLVYYGNQGQLEYDFRVAPAADPSQIALSFQGASTRIDSGDLVLSTANGDVRFHAPRIYQPAAPEFIKSSGNAAETVVAEVSASLPAIKSASLSETTTTAANSSSTRSCLIRPTSAAAAPRIL